MTAVITILILLTTLLLWVIFTPVLLFIDTDEGRYEVSQRGTLLMAIHPLQQFRPDIRIFGLPVPVPLKRKKDADQKSERRKKEVRKKPKIPLKDWPFLLYRLSKCFRLRSLRLDLDTDNAAVNAQLVPAMLMISQGPVHMNTNFMGRVYLHLEVVSSPHKIIWILILFLIKKQTIWK